MYTSPTRIRRAGPKVSSSCAQTEPELAGLAEKVTWCCSSRGTRSLPAKVGRSVTKWVDEVFVPGSVTGLRVSPLIESPWLVMLTTFPLSTCWRKAL